MKVKKWLSLLLACSLSIGTSSVAYAADKTMVDASSAKDRQILEELKKDMQQA